MTPYHSDQHTDEARAKRAQRAAWRKAPSDPLRERARKAQFWTECNKTNKNYGLVHSRAFFHNTGNIRLLMPRTRAHIQARAEARRSAYAAEMRESARQHALKKALAKADPMPLFEQVAT